MERASKECVELIDPAIINRRGFTESSMPPHHPVVLLAPSTGATSLPLRPTRVHGAHHLMPLYATHTWATPARNSNAVTRVNPHVARLSPRAYFSEASAASRRAFAWFASESSRASASAPTEVARPSPA